MALTRFVGQDSTTRRLQEAADFRLTTGQPLPHVLLLGSPGLGKTSLVKLWGEENGQHVEVLTPPASASQLVTAALKHDNVCMIFIDEIHTLKRSEQDQLLVTREERTLPYHGQRIAAPHVSIVAATTDPQMITRALMERFQIIAS